MNHMTHGLLYRVKRAARQIGEQHSHLGELLGALTPAIEQGRAGEARALFVRYRAAVGAHFALEEAVFFPALRGLHPDHTRDLELLGAEHAGFHDQIERLGELLETDFNGSGDALRALIEDLAVHESREERLVRELSADSPHPD